MIQFSNITGLAGCTLAVVAVLVSLPGISTRPRGQRALLAFIAAIALLVPFGALPGAAYVRGMIGDLSITSVVLLLEVVLRSIYNWPAPSKRERKLLLGGVVVAALILYPMALGWGYADPYRLGYGDPWMLGVLLLLAVAAWWGKSPLPVLSIALAVLAWGVGWYESTNLWDYLLDPLLALYAIGTLLWWGLVVLGRKQDWPRHTR